MNVNFCTSCKVVLANEEVVGGVCERCGSEVIHKDKEQWMLKITEYADRLIDDLAPLDFIERVKTQQINWIGRSTGAEVDFATTANESLKVYTTRPDTLFGATYMVIAPEHEFIERNKAQLNNYEEIVAYRSEASKKSDFERTELVKDKTGVMLDGVRAINPATGKEIPIFVSDYVLAGYGTGAIMAGPAHDERDWAFAKKFDLPIVEVVAGGDVQNEAFTDVATGKLVNSGFLNGLEVADAKCAMVKFLEERGIGQEKVNYKLRDWVFSRQRYWGEPIPLVECESCGWVAVPEEELPVRLPDVTSYEPTETGESPLSLMTDWVNCTCPRCGGKAKRETDTMPQWAGSSWYFLRYCDPHNDKELASREALQYWMPVDWYNGGMEHTTLHLLYSRFWAKFLYDIDIVPVNEPYAKRTSHGMILGENGEKMSKSRGNVVNPDDIIRDYGADTMRLYEMFIGDFEQAAPWNPQSIKGCKRFLERFLNLTEIVGTSSPTLEKALHKTIRKVGTDIDQMKFNTAIAAMMAFLNTVCDEGSIAKEDLYTFSLLLSPFAPHIAEEVAEILGYKGIASLAPWPVFDPEKCVENTVTIPVQVNGKVRTTVTVPKDADQAAILEICHQDPKLVAALDGKTPIKQIVVPGKIVNIVVK